MYYDWFLYFNVFYRVLNGELKYGEYEIVFYEKIYGKMLRNMKDLFDNNVNIVAIEWSYEFDYLCY